MTLWTSKDAVKATQGFAVGDWAAKGLSIDTRTIKAGELFIPLKDARDGHDFIPMAVEKGAIVMSERPISSVPALNVDDSFLALRDLAIAARLRSRAVRIAVTGSVGKTSVKEAIASALQGSARTHKSIKSFNNHWGVPLTMAVMPQDSEFGVFETGMNHAGELTDLSKLLKPHIAVITKIAEVHLEHFEDIAAIAAAKAEIFDGMEAGGVAILPEDDVFFEYLSNKARARGLSIEAVGAKDIDPNLRLKNSGAHHALNAAFALKCAEICQVSTKSAQSGLRKMPMLAGRGERFDAVLSGKKITVIDESYNANPTSMMAAFAAAKSVTSRKVAVIGDMGELGPRAAQMHMDLSSPLQDANFDRVITVGALAKHLFDVLPKEMRGAHLSDRSGIIAALRSDIKSNDTVLFKASNSVGLGAVIAQLRGTLT